jgi:LPS export ABC transporter protein LptC
VISEMDAMNKVLSTENAENVEITHTDSGYLKVVLKAPKVLAVKDPENPYVEMKEGLTADFYNRQKEKESNISSEYGINYQAKKLIVLKKNVKVVNTKGEKLFTEELFWDQTKEKIYTDKFVKIVTPDQTLTGYGMESNQDFTNWQIKKASGELNLNK